MLFHRSVMRLVVGCADMEVARHHQMTAERVFDITTVTCNSTGERWHFVCRRGEWYGAPLTNCTSGQHTYTYHKTTDRIVPIARDEKPCRIVTDSVTTTAAPSVECKINVGVDDRQTDRQTDRQRIIDRHRHRYKPPSTVWAET